MPPVQAVDMWREQLVALAARHALPAMCDVEGYVSPTRRESPRFSGALSRATCPSCCLQSSSWSSICEQRKTLGLTAPELFLLRADRRRACGAKCLSYP